MRLYFDTNVYDHIAKTDELHSVCRVIKSARCQVLASADNLFEVYAITDVRTRAHQLATLTSVATCFEDVPSSYVEAREVRLALRRPRNGQAAVMDARIREFEQRYEMSSRDLLERLVMGAVKETAEISRWLFWLEARANGADG